MSHVSYLDRVVYTNVHSVMAVKKENEYEGKAKERARMEVRLRKSE